MTSHSEQSLLTTPTKRRSRKLFSDSTTPEQFDDEEEDIILKATPPKSMSEWQNPPSPKKTSVDKKKSTKMKKVLKKLNAPSPIKKSKVNITKKRPKGTSKMALGVAEIVKDMIEEAMDADEVDRFSYVVQNDKGEQGLLVFGTPESSSAPPPDGSQSIQNFFGTEKLSLDGLQDIPENIQIIPYNSLIDGEIPINEMAKALFGKASDKNQVIYVNDALSKSPATEDSNATPTKNNFNSQPTESSYHSYDIPPLENYPSDDSQASLTYAYGATDQVEYTSESIAPKVSLLTNSYVQLNSERYPEEELNIDLRKNHCSELFKMALDYYKSVSNIESFVF